MGEQLYFETTITLPEVSGRSPLTITKLETDVANTFHRIADLNTKVKFHSISLKGSNAPIHAQASDQLVSVIKYISFWFIVTGSHFFLDNYKQGRDQRDIQYV